MDNLINLDANATFGDIPGLNSRVVTAIEPLLNPSSIHRGGQLARAEIENSREVIADYLGTGKDYRIVFTSGATEANNTAVMQAFLLNPSSKSKRNIVISAIEHASVIELKERLESLGVSVRIVSPKGSSFNVEQFLDACDQDTKLISLMLANNETGQILQVQEIFSAVKKKFPRVLCHCDAVQALGKMDFNPKELSADLLSLSGHKIGALSGVGALLVKKDVFVETLIVGGPQETRYRAGTENLAGIISFSEAVKYFKNNSTAIRASMLSQRDKIKNYITSELKDYVSLNVSDSHDLLPNTLNFRVKNIIADDLIVAMDLKGVCLSSGSACASGKPEPSHVLMAHGLSEREARESIRISLNGLLSDEQIDYAMRSLKDCIISMSKVSEAKLNAA